MAQKLRVLSVLAKLPNRGVDCASGGGEIVVAGTPEDVVREKRSYTGQYLKEVLKRGRKEAAE